MPLKPDVPRWDVGVYGSEDHGPRTLMLEEIQKHLKNRRLRLKIGARPQCMEDMYTLQHLFYKSHYNISFFVAK